MKTNQADYPVRSMCRVLGLSPSGYYAWVRRPPSARAKRDAELVLKIRKAYDEYRQVYGRPRLYAELKEAGEVVGEKRVGRLMKQEGIWGASRRRRGPKTTRRNADARPVVDLVERNFTADGPDQLWVADITYIPAWSPRADEFFEIDEAARFLDAARRLDVYHEVVATYMLTGGRRSEVFGLLVQDIDFGTGFVHISCEAPDATANEVPTHLRHRSPPDHRQRQADRDLYGSKGAWAQDRGTCGGHVQPSKPVPSSWGGRGVSGFLAKQPRDPPL